LVAAAWLYSRWRVLALVLLVGLASVFGAEALWRHHSAQMRQAAAGRATPVGPPRVDYARLDARINRLMLEPDMVGLAIGAVERGQVRFIRGYGVTQAGSADPVTPDTVFRWASLSKGVAATLVVQLAKQGRLSLDAPVTSLGTTLTLPGDAGRATVADLLSHRLGLPRNAWDDRLEAGEDPKTLRALLGTLAPDCPPGTCHAYQNIAFDAASEIVEHTTGQAYADVAHERLFAPLGMTSATVGRAGLESAQSWARPHHLRKAPAVVEDAYYRVPAAGGVNSSVRDLTRWMLAQLGGAPNIVSPDVLAALHADQVSTPRRGPRGPSDPTTDGAYGLGWRSVTFDGHRLVGHRGSVDGYGSLILFDSVDRSGIVMLWNANYYRPARLEFEFFDRLYGLPFTDRLQLDEKNPAEKNAVAARSALRP
jgi:beta-lactamase class C